MVASKSLFAGIDIGGTSVKAGLFDEEGTWLARASCATPSLVNTEGYKAVVDVIQQLLSQAGAWSELLQGIGVAIPCPVPASARISMAANLTLDDTGFVCALQQAFPQAAIKYVNDANAAAMGEMWQGGARGVRNLVMVTIGTGIGGAVLIDGRVVEGICGAAGEIGHMCMNPDETRACGCGGHGCLEQYASAKGIVNSYLMECERQGIAPLELSGPSDSRRVFQAFCEGDVQAHAAVETMITYLARALSLVGCVVDPDIFLIGGGASASADIFLEQLSEQYRSFAMLVNRSAPIKVATLGNDAGALGAAYVALQASGRQ